MAPCRRPTRILLALVARPRRSASPASALAAPGSSRPIAVAEPIGGLWLNALQMTIVPLVVALLITGIAASAEAARAEPARRPARSILFVVLLWISSLDGGAADAAAPRPVPAAGRLRRGAAQRADQRPTPVGEAPGFADFLRSIVPTNPVAAAAEDAILPLIVFTIVFAFALTRLPEEPRERLVGFFQAVADAMLVVIGWVLWIGADRRLRAGLCGRRARRRRGVRRAAPLCAHRLGGRHRGLARRLAAGLSARGSRRVRFTRAVAPSQAVAFSTQSSLACLPAMLRAAGQARRAGRRLGRACCRWRSAIFRATGPAMNLAVAIYIAYWFGIELTPAQMAFGVAAAATTTMGAVGIPGQASFVTSIAPICLAMGVPIEPLALLIAVEILPDIVRTLGNVSMDVAATATVARRSGFEADRRRTAEEDRLLEEGA